jgi:CDP-glucose 4,6-dehydratase
MEALRELMGGPVETLSADLPPSPQPLNPSSSEVSSLSFQPSAFSSSSPQPFPHPVVAVMITTDKCYENREWLHGYREEDALGGYDPYSSSKAACEIAIASWRRAFFSQPSTDNPQATNPVFLASARAGNVIGGGDWAQDRIVPDCIRALQRGETIPVRNKTSTRPWQHVLEPLSGYLTLAATMIDGCQFGVAICAQATQPRTTNHQHTELCSAFNFGPALDSNRTVADIVQEILKHWPGEWEDKSDSKAPHEAGKLHLATDKAFHLLGWQPRWNFETTIEKTVSWYHKAKECLTPEDFSALTRRQILEYQKGG